MSVGDRVALFVPVSGLPDDALAAAAMFYADHLPRLKLSLGGEAVSLTLHFAAAPHDHRAWCRAAIAGLAREHAPCRVNGLAGGSSSAVAAAAAWLDHAPGVTGQLLVLANVLDGQTG